MHSTAEYVIINHQDVSFLWKIESEEGSPSQLDCEFRTSFSPKHITPQDDSLHSSKKSNYLYDFSVVNTQVNISCYWLGGKTVGDNIWMREDQA